jgi:hypothetical protein
VACPHPHAPKVLAHTVFTLSTAAPPPTLSRSCACVRACVRPPTRASKRTEPHRRSNARAEHSTDEQRCTGTQQNVTHAAHRGSIALPTLPHDPHTTLSFHTLRKDGPHTRTHGQHAWSHSSANVANGGPHRTVRCGNARARVSGQATPSTDLAEPAQHAGECTASRV